MPSIDMDIHSPVIPTTVIKPEYGSIRWANDTWFLGGHCAAELTQWIFDFMLAENLTLKAAIRRKNDEGFAGNYRTIYGWVSELPEYKQMRDAKKLNPTKQARYSRGKRGVNKFETQKSLPLEKLLTESEIVKKIGVPNYIHDCAIEEARFEPEWAGDQPSPQTDIASMASYLARVKPKTQAQIKREEKKRRVALATIQIDPLEMGYENAKLRAENERLRHEVERLKPVPIDADKLGSREVKGLAQRLGLNQNLSTEETRDLVREALANRDNLIKARQLLGQTEVEVLKAKITEQQELLKLWELSHQYTLGQRDTPWSVLGLRELEGIEYNRPRYRKLIEFWHPDRNKLPIATEMTAKINKAWTAYCGTFN